MSRQGIFGRGRSTARRAGAIAALGAVFGLAACGGGDIASPFVPIPPGVPPPEGRTLPMVDVVTGGERPSSQLTSWAEGLTDDTNVSVAALSAYGYAAAQLAYHYPNCNLQWNTLAGIGFVETRHGTYGGSAIDEFGNAMPPIIGVALDGSPGFASIPDTDGGELDGDPEHDRAVGPMQFIPETWRYYGHDASGDENPDPNNIDDAALTAGFKLCDYGRDLSTEQGWTDAIMSYNASGEYVRDVRDAAAAYSVPTRAR